MFNRDSNQINKVKSLKLKPSRFNVLLDKKENIKLYNSFTGEIVKFCKNNKEEVKSILRKKRDFYERDKYSCQFFSRS
jgi:uncharacterized protein